MKIASDILIQLTQSLTPNFKSGVNEVDPQTFSLKPGKVDGSSVPTLSKTLTGSNWEIVADINIGDAVRPAPTRHLCPDYGFDVPGQVFKSALDAAAVWGVTPLSSSVPDSLSGIYFVEMDKGIHLVVPGPHSLVSFGILTTAIAPDALQDGVSFLSGAAAGILLDFVGLTNPHTVEVAIIDSHTMTFTAFDSESNMIWNLSVSSKVTGRLISKESITSRLEIPTEALGNPINARKWCQKTKAGLSKLKVSVPEFHGRLISTDYLNQSIKVMGLLRTAKLSVDELTTKQTDVIRFVGIPSDRPGRVSSLESRFAIAPCAG